MLKPRERIAFGDGLDSIKKSWKRLLEDNEQTFLTDNQPYLWTHPELIHHCRHMAATDWSHLEFSLL